MLSHISIAICGAAGVCLKIPSCPIIDDLAQEIVELPSRPKQTAEPPMIAVLLTADMPPNTFYNARDMLSGKGSYGALMASQ